MKHQAAERSAPPSALLRELERERQRRDRLWFAIICGALLLLTPVVVLGVLDLGVGLFVALPVILVLCLVIARRPQVGFLVITLCVVCIDQAPQLVPIFTDKLYVYFWPPGLEGLIERPIGFLFLFILFVLVCRHLVARQKLLRGGDLIVPFGLFMLCVVVAAAYGYLTGGMLKIIVVEIRPFVYFFEAYLLAYNLVTQKNDVRAFFWLVIAGSALKALQGIYIYVRLHGQLGNNTLMSHEESFFFIGVLLFVILLSMHYRWRRQLTAALCVLPVVLVTLVLNNRRTDYVAFLLALGTAWAILFVLNPKARLALGLVAGISTLLLGGYLLAFADSTAPIGQPARGIVAVFHPSATDVRDLQSNQYRIVEDFDLRYTIAHENFFVGMGFGKLYLEPVPLTTVFPGIGQADQYYNYVPHNNIYWVWMRFGAIGFLVFWYLFGSLIVRGCLIARRLRDPYLQVAAIYAVGMAVAEIVVAYADYQLFFYRNVIYIGLLAGLLMKLPEVERNEAGTAQEAVRRPQAEVALQETRPFALTRDKDHSPLLLDMESHS
jgi:O-antigen ligase